MGRAGGADIALNVAAAGRPRMAEYDEFAEALFGQLSVELGEEREIAELGQRAAEALGEAGRFADLRESASAAASRYRAEAAGFLGVDVPESRLGFPELAELKVLKGRKVFAAPGSGAFVGDLVGAVARGDQGAVAGLMRGDTARYLVYSTYAIQYISRITTTYGDYLDGTIYLNGFVLSRYPRIILYRRGEPYAGSAAEVAAGYAGAVKMTVLEETVHSAQGALQRINGRAAAEVNSINEELARIVLGLDDAAVGRLTDYCQLQAVPEDFPVARRANLFFFLNPDHFLTGQIGPDVMTHTHVEVDPEISRAVPELPGIYARWLGPIQRHHAAFSAMEGMAGFAVEGILGGDPDFASYLSTFAGADASSYQVRKGMGAGFVREVHAELGRGAFARIIGDPPSTRELKEPGLYLERARG